MANEKRLIGANELTDRLNHTTMVAHPNLFPGLLAAVEIVDDSHTVDAVEVVRCKDCQKCLIDNSKMGLHLCMKMPSFPVRVKLDGFCSDGGTKGR